MYIDVRWKNSNRNFKVCKINVTCLYSYTADAMLSFTKIDETYSKLEGTHSKFMSGQCLHSYLYDALHHRFNVIVRVALVL